MHHLLLVLVLSALPVSAAERWEELPPTPGPIHCERSGKPTPTGSVSTTRSTARARR
jgi:hypothetical protein